MTRALRLRARQGRHARRRAGNSHETWPTRATTSPAPTTRPARPTSARSTTRPASTCRSRGRTCSASPRSARRSKADYSNYTTEPPRARSSSPPRVAGSVTASARRRTATNENQILSTYPLKVLQAEGEVDANGRLTPTAWRPVRPGVPGTRPPRAPACGYYQFLQGTSMATPHAAGVAALGSRRTAAAPGGHVRAEPRRRHGDCCWAPPRTPPARPADGVLPRRGPDRGVRRHLRRHAAAQRVLRRGHRRTPWGWCAEHPRHTEHRTYAAGPPRGVRLSGAQRRLGRDDDDAVPPPRPSQRRGDAEPGRQAPREASPARPVSSCSRASTSRSARPSSTRARRCSSWPAPGPARPGC